MKSVANFYSIEENHDINLCICRFVRHLFKKDESIISTLRDFFDNNPPQSSSTIDDIYIMNSDVVDNNEDDTTTISKKSSPTTNNDNGSPQRVFYEELNLILAQYMIGIAFR